MSEENINPSEFFERTYKKTFQSTINIIEKRDNKKWLFLKELAIPSEKFTVLISQAHGGINPETGKYVTPGKRSPKWDGMPPVSMKNIYYEGVGSRLINKQLSEGLSLLGIRNIIINNTWEDTPVWVKRKRIIELTKKYKNCIAIEIHSNATKNMQGKAQGFEFFTYPGKTKSDIFAKLLGYEFDEEFPNMIHRRFKAGEEKEARFGILKSETLCDVKIVLSENGFMDDRKFCTEYLMTEKGRFRIAKFHLKGIVKFLNYLQNEEN